jgi:hypothetical protein
MRWFELRALLIVLFYTAPYAILFCEAPREQDSQTMVGLAWNDLKTLLNPLAG